MVYHRQGFTLVEVLVAVAIAAIAFVTVYQGLGQSIDAARELRDHGYAMWLAQNRLVEHQLKGDWPAIDTREGDTDYVGQKWHWQEKISGTPETDMRRVEITIARKPDSRTLATLVGFLRKTSKENVQTQ